MPFRHDDPWAICERSGQQVRRSDTVVEWTGLRVKREYAEPKHPSLDIPAPYGEDVVDDPTGYPQNVFIVGNGPTRDDY